MTAKTSHRSAAEPTLDAQTLDAIVRRASALYSLPAVAAEVIQLTESPAVDARALKECIETDPALTVKILRVVNSSLFGLSREVSDLNQALALLGTKPLKLLVLGFSLPEELFAEVAREQLDWYWSTTLTRAVAAREISEQLFDRPGDDAFLAGLFQDLGVLVLLSQLKNPYAQLLTGVIEQQVDLCPLEEEALGFDHRQLTAALLDHWNLPEQFAEAIATPRDVLRLAHGDQQHHMLAKVVHLAELVAELVGQNRLDVLPDLMETGAAYCQLEKEQLNALVALLQPKVKQLAEVLSLDLPEGQDYLEIIAAAHAQVSALTEQLAEPLSRPAPQGEQAYASLLDDAAELRQAVDGFLHRPGPGMAGTGQAGSSHADVSAIEAASALLQGVAKGVAPGTIPTAHEHFLRELTLVVGNCRSRRQPVSLLLIEVGTQGNALDRQVLGQMLEAACRSIEVPEMLCELLSPYCRVLVLPACERREAVRLAEQTLASIRHMVQRFEAQGKVLHHTANAGVCSSALPPKNFSPQALVDTADRCLSAARSTGTQVVKSLEIY